jgi:hypothetical protein
MELHNSQEENLQNDKPEHHVVCLAENLTVLSLVLNPKHTENRKQILNKICRILLSFYAIYQ